MHRSAERGLLLALRPARPARRARGPRRGRHGVRHRMPRVCIHAVLDLTSGVCRRGLRPRRDSVHARGRPNLPTREGARAPRGLFARGCSARAVQVRRRLQSRAEELLPLWGSDARGRHPTTQGRATGVRRHLPRMCVRGRRPFARASLRRRQVPRTRHWPRPQLHVGIQVDGDPIRAWLPAASSLTTRTSAPRLVVTALGASTRRASRGGRSGPRPRSTGRRASPSPSSGGRSRCPASGRARRRSGSPCDHARRA